MVPTGSPGSAQPTPRKTSVRTNAEPETPCQHVEKVIRDEASTAGFAGRFGAGLTRINDGSFLFLHHMIAKMKPDGSRIAIVFNDSPLFTSIVSASSFWREKYRINVSCFSTIPPKCPCVVSQDTLLRLLPPVEKFADR